VENVTFKADREGKEMTSDQTPIFFTSAMESWANTQGDLDNNHGGKRVIQDE